MMPDLRVDEAEETAAMVRELLRLLVEENGFDPAAVIAGAHAEAAAAMVIAFGGMEAAERMRAAAAQVAHLPSLADVVLAAREPAGTA
jgi:uncharacterized phosphosugar-binding protein